MSVPAPSDLAVAFRSFARRLDEALGGLAEDPVALAAAGPPAEALDALVRRTARELHVPATGSLAELGAALAERIQHRPADEWTDEQLHGLETTALECGRLLRQIDAAGPEHD